MATTVTYYRIIGTMDLPDGQIRHFVQPVADFTGASLAIGGLIEQYDFPAAQEKPRGTIVKVTLNTTRTIDINPTS